jgi:Concanavalin A-like lectin/glucanases superfamily/Bacterial surface protein, Ig-like domain/Regulator of chromosome condensation (RCC1) repeat
MKTLGTSIAWTHAPLWTAVLALWLLFPLLTCGALYPPGPGHALAFSGTNYVFASPTGSVSGNFTVEAWVNPADPNNYAEIVSFRAPGEYTFDLQMNPAVGLHGDIGSGTSYWLTTSADANFSWPTGQWLHVAYVVTPNTYTIYTNGVQITNGTFGPSTLPLLYDANHNITIGAWFPDTALFKGQIDEVRVWNTVRTQVQIQSNFTNRLTGTEPGLMAYYRFDEPPMKGATIQARDSSGHGFHGTPVNRPLRVRTGPQTVAINGANPFTNECHTAFTDPGVGAPPLAVSVVGSFNLALKADRTAIGWGNPAGGQNVIPGHATNLVSVDAGYADSLALKPDGTLIAWGANVYGENTIPPTATNVIAIAGGYYVHEALRGDGRVLAWGVNTFGQTSVPASATNIVAISTTEDHSLALKPDGTVIGWGDNTYGQRTPPPEATNIVAIATGVSHSLVLRGDGRVFAWGGNFSGQTNVPSNATNVVAIAAGSTGNLALRADGTLVGWGDNFFGENNIPADATNIVAMACGGFYNVAQRGDGKLFIWGNNQFGQLIAPTNLGTAIPYTTIGSVNANTPGTYFLSYSATNSLGPAAPNVRTVVVADRLAPTVTLLGTNPNYTGRNVPYIDPGATATDLCAGDLTSSIVRTGNVDTNVLGTNILSYYVTDPAGHASTTNNRVVVVLDRPYVTGLSSSFSGPDPSIGNRTVTLNATVFPNLTDAGAYFEYGLTTNYGSLSPFKLIPAYLTSSNISYTAIDVSSGIALHWRVVAGNDWGMTNSADQITLVPGLYPAGDLNGDGLISQGEFNTVLSNYFQLNGRPYLTNVTGLGSSLVTFSLGNAPLTSYTIEWSSNLFTWQPLGPAAQRFQFTDPAAPTNRQRLYRLRWP